MANKYRLMVKLRSQMLAHVMDCFPEEACGLIGGKPGMGEVAFPIENDLHSVFSFRMKPDQQLEAFLEMEQLNLECTGIYHSHPLGPAYPSDKDCQEFAYPGTINLIWYSQGDNYFINGYLLDGDEVKDIPLIWVGT